MIVDRVARTDRCSRCRKLASNPFLPFWSALIGEHCGQHVLNIKFEIIIFETCYTHKHAMQCCGDSSSDDWPPDSRLQSSTHPSSGIRKKSKTREDGAARLSDADDASSSSSDSSPVDSSQRSKGFGTSSLEVTEAGKKGKILNSRSPTLPKNGCFTVLLQYNIQWIGTAVTLPKTVACSRRESLSHLQTVGRASRGHSLTMCLHPLIAL
jgi:hypothetical protein